MKKCLLLLAIIVCSCAGDGVNPDLTYPIVGTWKTEIRTVSTYRTQGIWEIVKKDGKYVEIKVFRTVWPNLENDDEVDIYPELTLNTAWMSDEKTLVLEYDLAAPNDEFCGIKGEGVLAGDKLTMVTYTECKGEDPNPVTQEFTRQ